MTTPQMIFLNLPVADLAKATAFYEAIGCTQDARFSNETCSSMQLSDTIVFMLMTRDMFQGFSPKPLSDAHATAQLLFCISRDSRASVDATIDAAVAAGGKGDVNAPDEYGWMYGRSFEDPDGNLFGANYMDLEAMLAAHPEGPAHEAAAA